MKGRRTKRDSHQIDQKSLQYLEKTKKVQTPQEKESKIEIQRKFLKIKKPASQQQEKEQHQKVIDRKQSKPQPQNTVHKQEKSGLQGSEKQDKNKLEGNLQKKEQKLKQNSNSSDQEQDLKETGRPQPQQVPNLKIQKKPQSQKTINYGASLSTPMPKNGGIFNPGGLFAKNTNQFSMFNKFQGFLVTNPKRKKSKPSQQKNERKQQPVHEQPELQNQQLEPKEIIDPQSIFSKNKKAQQQNQQQNEGNSEQLQKLQNKQHDPTKSTGNYKYQSDSEILFMKKSKKIKIGKGQSLENLEIVIQKVQEQVKKQQKEQKNKAKQDKNKYWLIVQIPSTKIQKVRGLLIKGKSQIRNIGNKKQNIFITFLQIVEGKGKQQELRIQFESLKDAQEFVQVVDPIVTI